MRGEQSLVNIKRKEWRIDIRRKQLNEYFSKRRLEMLSQDQQTEKHRRDQDRCMHIAEKINRFYFTQLRCIFIELIQMDKSLATFYYFTHLNPQSPPTYFKNIFAEIPGSNQQDQIFPELTFQKSFSNQEKMCLQQIWQKMQKLWQKAEPEYIAVLSEMKRVDNTDMLIRQDFISFLSITLSALLTFKNIAIVLDINLERVMLVGTEKMFDFEINTTLRILYNILSGSDELLAPFINDFLEMNGCSYESEGLYYNLFLIKNIPQSTNIKIFQYYVNILDNQRGQVLENYQAIINTLYAALKVCPEFQDRTEKSRFINVCERIVDFISVLLAIINMRYESFSSQSENDKDYGQFLSRFTWILQKLSSIQKVIGNVMESKSINTFILNHLNNSSVNEQIKIVSTCLNILSAAAGYSYSLHFFLNEEPRFMIKVMLLFEKCLEINYKDASFEAVIMLNSITDLLSQLSDQPKVTQDFLSRGLVHKIGKIYFQAYNQSKVWVNIRQSCEIIYVNLLTHVKNYMNEVNVIYSYLFDDNSAYVMLIEMLRLIPKRREITRKALIFLSFLACNCQHSKYFASVRQALLSETLASRLNQLLYCETEQLIEKAEYLLKTIEWIKKVPQDRFYVQNYGQEQQEDMI